MGLIDGSDAEMAAARSPPRRGTCTVLGLCAPVVDYYVLVFVITKTFAPSAAASDARSEAAGDAGPSSRPSDNADEAAPPAPEGLVGWNN